MIKIGKEKTVVFPGRFQPLHKGHYHVIKRLKTRYKLVLLIGSSKKMNTEDNPLSFSERKEVIKSCFSDLRIFPLPDVNHDRKWVQNIEKKVKFDFAVSGNDRSRRCFKKEGYKVKDPEYHRPELYSGDEIRKRVLQNKKWESLVPECSLKKLKEIKFKARIKKINQRTKN